MRHPAHGRSRRSVRPLASGLLIALSCLGGLPWPGGVREAGAGEPSVYRVRLVSPAGGSFMSGPTVLEAEVSFPPSDPVARVEFYVDDVRVATIARRPFRVTWDAGPDFLPRRVRAVAISASGARASAEASTRRLVPDQQEQVQVVTVYATVREKGRGFVTDLAREDFVIEEDGVPQVISHFSRDVRPVSWVILLDVSASMRGERIDTARKAALLFVDSLGPRDRASVITFSDVIDSTPFAGADREPLRRMILSARAGGGTALYDALVEASARLREAEGKKALLLLSDGRDQGMDGYGPGSTHTFEEALERLQRAEVAAYAVGLGEDLDEQLDFRRRRSLREILETLSDRTGGRAARVRRVGGLREVFRFVAQEVRMQYSLGYTPSNTRRDGAWRAISVRASRPGLQVTARRGYYAPGGS